ncbi:MAG TPA: hypothetical protein VNT03_02370 [Baekduia sp.]|nr:hypothetical protein [Baekduia sp.]
MLDAAHRGALRAVAQGSATEEHAVAVRNLAVAGLVQPLDGAWTPSPAGYAVLDLEGGGGVAQGAGGGSDVMSKIRAWFMT